MANNSAVAARFRKFRERAGLSEDEASWQMGISPSCLWDIENIEGDLS
jgi:cytoskeletal protein RodZ